MPSPRCETDGVGRKLAPRLRRPNRASGMSPAGLVETELASLFPFGFTIGASSPSIRGKRLRPAPVLLAGPGFRRDQPRRTRPLPPCRDDPTGHARP